MVKLTEIAGPLVRKFVEEEGQRIERLRARLDAIEVGLGDRIFAELMERVRTGKLSAMNVGHQLEAELQRRQRGNASAFAWYG